MRQEVTGFGDAVASAGPYANNTSLQTDNHTITPSLTFYRPDALPDAQPTASKHWRQNISNLNKRCKVCRLSRRCGWWCRSRGGRPCSIDPALMESLEMSSVSRRPEARSLARDSTASWHGRSSRSDVSDVDWDCSGTAAVPSNHELIAYFDGLRESAA